MKSFIKNILGALALSVSFTTLAQSAGNEKFSIRAYANIGLDDAIKIKNILPGTTSNSSSNYYGADFGWTFWQKQSHSLEANIGIAYAHASVKSGLENLDYSYSASIEADMDGNSYIRHYELQSLNQKYSLGSIVIPVYVSYAYRCNNWLGVHADLGFNFGFRAFSKLSNMTGEGYSYGIYPQYDNLKIEESYINDFGLNTYTTSEGSAPAAGIFSCAILYGIGTEFRIYGPFAADLSFRYNAGLTNLYKTDFKQISTYNEDNAPVTYTVKDGPRIKSLTNYTNTSKLSQFSVNISLIYRF